MFYRGGTPEKESAAIKKGKSVRLKADMDVTYESADKTIAKVDKNGLVKGVKKGTTYRIGCSGKPGTYADCSGLIY